jgi:hypothetical protein
MVSFDKEKANPTIMNQKEKVTKVLKGGHFNKDLDISKVREKDMPF